MSASVTEAARVNNELDPQAGNITIKAPSGDGKMKAGQWDPEAKKVLIKEVPIPIPGPNQFLVKLAGASLCHSDIMVRSGCPK